MAMVMAMSSISNSSSVFHHPTNHTPTHSYFVVLSFPYRTASLYPRLYALKTGSDGGQVKSHDVYNSDLLRKPMLSLATDVCNKLAKDPSRTVEDDEDSDAGRSLKQRDEEEWIDWEDQILEVTAPLVGFVRMVLHSGKYGSGERLSPEHEKNIIERLLHYHPECKKKIGFGIDYITIGYHPEFENSRCLFIVRKDGEFVDFSYWKCIKGFIRNNYPQYASRFISKHFRKRRRE